MNMPVRTRGSIVAILLSIAIAGCGSSSTPPPSASPSASSAPSASAAPTVAASTAPSPSAPSSAATTYVVRKGDTMYSIAIRFHITLAALRKANPKVTDPRALRPGTRLTIPAR